MKTKLGVIGIVQEDLDTDHFAALRKLSLIGYEGIEARISEIEAVDVSPSSYTGFYSDLGLSLVAVHTLKGECVGHEQAVVEKAALYGAERVCIAWGPTDSREQVLADAEYYNKLGEQCKSAGLELTYHNHDHEFGKLPGEELAYIDLLMQETDPELVRMHLDIAWCAFAGSKPIEYAQRYANRLSVIHVKDIVDIAAAGGDREQVEFTEVGEGVVPNQELVQWAVGAEVPWLVVEQDRLGKLPAWKSVQKSYANTSGFMKRLG